MSSGEAQRDRGSSSEVRGRYTIYGEIASGGMATIQYGRLAGPAGFARNVAIKRLHAQFARDPNFVSMFLDEARLAARIAHVNVIATLDVLSEGDDVSVVMEYVHGESLAGLLAVAKARGEDVPVRVACTLLSHTLHGLHAAHGTCGEHGEALGIVHRDVSPQNVLVGQDGIARVLDFGIAKAKDQRRVTPTGELKGKLAYMAPEQYRGEEVDRRVDVYGASVVFWEVLTGSTLFDGPNDASVARAVLEAEVKPPSALVSSVPEGLDRIVLRGLSRVRAERFETAREMALAIERDFPLATQSEVSDWVHGLIDDDLQLRSQALRKMQLRAEGKSTDTPVPGTRRMQTPLPPAEIPLGTPATRVGPQAQPGTAAHSLPVERLRSRKWLALGLLLALVGGVVWASVGGKEKGVKTKLAVPPPPAAVRAPPPLPDAVRQADAIAPQGPRPRLIEGPEPSNVPAAPAHQPVAEPTEAPESIGKSRDAESSPARKERPKGMPVKMRERDCSQPFYVDAKGIKRVKRDCL
jgi:serine/threonine-protein kinase